MSRTPSRSTDTVPEAVLGVHDEVANALATWSSEAGQFSVLGPDPWFVLWNRERSGYGAFLEGRRVIVSWRSPVGPPGGQPALLARLAAYAEDVGKLLVVLEAGVTARAAAVVLGMPTLWIGSEGRVDLSTWSLGGARGQKLRWARNHARSLPMEWREAYPTVDPEDWEALTALQRAWKVVRPERHTDSFLRTDFAELAEHRRFFVAEGPWGMSAFVACSPVSERGWYLQDLVRYADAPRGSLEGAIILALETFREEDFDFVTNGQLPFWHPDDGWSDPQELGVVGRRVFRFFDHQYRFSSINRFRSKLVPDVVEPMYLLRSRRYVTPFEARELQRILGEGKVST